MRSLAPVLVLFFLLSGCAAEERPATDETETGAGERLPASVEVGDVMPPYTAKRLDGGEFSLADAGEVVLVNIWATWCGPCRAEIPDLIALQNEFGGRGFTVIGASIDAPATEGEVKPFAQKYGITYPIVLDPEARIADLFETSVIPTSALIDRAGKVVWMEVGIVDAGDPELRSAIERALQG
ncbi:MAG: redoxin domain-containing protein [Thermoanaerobaculia bacterium]